MSGSLVIEGSIKLRATCVGAETTSARINFNLSRFSAPNPILKFKTTAANNLPAAGAEVTRKSKRLRNNATLRIVDPAAVGTTYTAKTLFEPSTGAVIKRVKSTTQTVCSTKKNAVTMLTAGSCRLVVTVIANRRPVTINLTIRVA